MIEYSIYKLDDFLLWLDLDSNQKNKSKFKVKGEWNETRWKQIVNSDSDCYFDSFFGSAKQVSINQKIIKQWKEEEKVFSSCKDIPKDYYSRSNCPKCPRTKLKLKEWTQLITKS